MLKVLAVKSLWPLPVCYKCLDQHTEQSSDWSAQVGAINRNVLHTHIHTGTHVWSSDNIAERIHELKDPLKRLILMCSLWPVAPKLRPFTDYEYSNLTLWPKNRKQMTWNDEYKAGKKRSISLEKVAELPDDDDLCSKPWKALTI